MKFTDLPSLNHLRSAMAPEGVKPFHVGIVIGPGFNPMDMVGLHTVFTIAPGARIYRNLRRTIQEQHREPSLYSRRLPVPRSDSPAALCRTDSPAVKPVWDQLGFVQDNLFRMLAWARTSYWLPPRDSNPD